MTVLEEYKVEVDSLIDRLDNMSFGFIDEDEMVEICNKILSSTEVDEVGVRYRIERFKKLSDEGYYLTYDID